MLAMITPPFSCAFKLSYTSGIYVNSHFYSRFRYVSERPTKDQNLSLNISASAKHYMFDSFTILIKQEKEFIEECFPNMWWRKEKKNIYSLCLSIGEPLYWWWWSRNINILMKNLSCNSFWGTQPLSAMCNNSYFTIHPPHFLLNSER